MVEGMVNEAEIAALNASGMTEHLYTSTACQHQLHGQCRKTCKYCSTACLCPCHRGS